MQPVQQLQNNLGQVKQNISSLSNRFNQLQQQLSQNHKQLNNIVQQQQAHINEINQISQSFNQFQQQLDNSQQLARQVISTAGNTAGMSQYTSPGMNQFSGGYNKQFQTTQAYGQPAARSINTQDRDISSAYYNMKQNAGSQYNPAQFQASNNQLSQNSTAGQYQGTNSQYRGLNQANTPGGYSKQFRTSQSYGQPATQSLNTQDRDVGSQYYAMKANNNQYTAANNLNTF
ncbi:MAG: hypothetical protein ACOC5A_02005 [Halanaerobiales bacterium]